MNDTTAGRTMTTADQPHPYLPKGSVPTAPTDSTSPTLALALLAVVGAAASLVFIIAGTKMTGIESISGNSTAEAYYQAMGWFSYGMAALSLLAVAPYLGATFATTPASDRPLAAIPAGTPTAPCPKCPLTVPAENLPGHLVIVHGLTDEDARALAGSMT